MNLEMHTKSFQSSCKNTSCCPPQEPVRNTHKKIGRNDPCHCGSEKKFKKCCGANK